CWQNPRMSCLEASREQRKEPPRGVRAERGAFFAFSETKKISEPGSKSAEGQIGKKTPGFRNPRKSSNRNSSRKISKRRVAREFRHVRKKITNTNPQSKISKTRIDKRR